MIKTDKFNSMIEAFECDFVLAKEGKYSISELENKVRFKDENLMADIDLLEELSYLLRYGKAEIHLIEEPKTNADRIRAMSDEELAEWLNGQYEYASIMGWQHDSSLLDWLQSEAE